MSSAKLKATQSPPLHSKAAQTYAFLGLLMLGIPIFGLSLLQTAMQKNNLALYYSK